MSVVRFRPWAPLARRARAGAQPRLQKYSLDGSTCNNGGNKKTLDYSNGNMSMKSGVCATDPCMNYGGSGAGPQQLTSITGTYNGVANPTFLYDANGNMRCMLAAGQACNANQAARFYSWTSYNMVASIAQGSTSVGLAYGSEHQRYKMCAPNCTSPTATTLYLNDPVTGAMSEKAVSGANSTFRDYIIAEGQIVAARVNVAGVLTWKYITPDHLGSVTTATSVPGNGGIERDSYDAWGKRRNPDASDDPGCTLSSVLPRGFTGHEMLDRFCLVNMNGRIYDPGLARFLSADSIVPNPFSFHGYQRYAYVNNNPLNATDPSGHSGEGAGDSCGVACQQNILPIDSYETISNETVTVTGWEPYTPDGEMLREMQNRTGAFNGDTRGADRAGMNKMTGNCPVAPGQAECETVVVTGAPPKPVPLTTPILLWPQMPQIPVLNFQFEPEGGDSDSKASSKHHSSCPTNSVGTGAVAGSFALGTIETPELVSFGSAIAHGATVAEAAGELGPWGLVGGFAVGTGVYAADQYSNGAISNFLANRMGICTGG